MSTRSATGPDAPAFDLSPYLRAPAMSAAQCVPVARALESASPRRMAAFERLALDRLVARAGEVGNILEARARRAGRVRPALDALVSAWSCGCAVLEGYMRLESPLGRRAGALHAIMFSGGLGFLGSDASSLWSEASRRYGRVVEESSRAELVLVVGEEVTAWIETATNALGEAIGCGSVPAAPRDRGLLARAIRETQLALVDYARAMAGSVDHLDPESVERFRRAMAPLDRFRADRAQRSRRAKPAANEAGRVEASPAVARDASPSVARDAAAPSPDARVEAREDRTGNGRDDGSMRPTDARDVSALPSPSRALEQARHATGPEPPR